MRCVMSSCANKQRYDDVPVFDFNAFNFSVQVKS